MFRLLGASIIRRAGTGAERPGTDDGPAEISGPSSIVLVRYTTVMLTLQLPPPPLSRGVPLKTNVA